jgi:hypothetical protein
MSESNYFEPTQYEDGIETNLYDIANQICAHPPQSPCSIQLVLDHEVDKATNLDDYEFDLLKTFVMACFRSLFGESANPLALSDTDFDRLNAYIHSIGYHIVRTESETETSRKLSLSFRRYADYYKDIHDMSHLKKYMQPSS